MVNVNILPLKTKVYYITLYGVVEDTIVGVTLYGSKGWSFRSVWNRKIDQNIEYSDSDPTITYVDYTITSPVGHGVHLDEHIFLDLKQARDSYAKSCSRFKKLKGNNRRFIRRDLCSSARFTASTHLEIKNNRKNKHTLLEWYKASTGWDPDHIKIV